MQLLVTLFAAVIAAGAALSLPLALLVMVAINFIAHFVVLGTQLIVTRFPSRQPSLAEPLAQEPFVSIHVPTHNEPPEVVMQTLLSLSQLKWSNYEVLVIDNNTDDPRLWRPLQQLCNQLGPKFRFFHVEGLSGFKAGAMNFVRKFMDPRASFIFVVDADYVVDRKALRTAFRYYTDEKIGLIQFPQDYRNVTHANRGIALDYKHFFSGFMNIANALDCVPSTGTLALINVRALERIGGFSTKFVTEDAELGLKLALNGYRSVYVNRTIGAGLIPHELDGLKKQRWRWAFGNAQIIRRQWKELLFSPSLSRKQRIGFLCTLSAWFNFNLIPSLALILLSLYSLVGSLETEQVYTVLLSGFTLSTYLFLKYGVLHYSLSRDGHSIREVWNAFATHVGLGWIFSASWIRCLFNSSSPFIRTNKFLSKVVPGVFRTTLAEVALGTGLVVASFIFALTDFVLGPAAALVMCAARFAIFWVWAQTRHTLVVTTRLFSPAERAPVPLSRAA